jgi:hypothetical protein
MSSISCPSAGRYAHAMPFARMCLLDICAASSL